MISDQNIEECDATDDDSSNADGHKKILAISTIKIIRVISELNLCNQRFKIPGIVERR